MLNRNKWIGVALVGLAVVSTAFLPAVLANAADPIGVGAATSLADGPYVRTLEQGSWRSASVDDTGKKLDVAVEGQSVVVPSIDDVASFSVALRPAPPPAASTEPLDPDAPLLVLADTHGEYPILVALLKAQGVLDSRLGWSFGRGHLVVTGDMLDRGARQIEILWLLYKLEGEARAAGGRVHVLVGNHEAMLLRGDARYLNPRYHEIAKRLGVTAYSELLGPDTVLGGWLRSRPAVLKLDKLLLLHGGVSPELASSGLPPDAINAIVRRYLDIPFDQKPAEGTDEALVMGSEGPLWYRGYFPTPDKPPAVSDADVTSALARFGVSRILVGHTPVEKVAPSYGGKVIAVQVYPHLDATTGLPILEGALRSDGKWFRVTAQGERIPLNLID